MMRGVEVTLLDLLQAAEEPIVRFARERQSEKLGSLDLLPELGRLRERAVVVRHSGTPRRSGCL